jgi:alcohol dehydrogenase class IV
MANSFQIARTPYLIFGLGSRMQLPALAGRFGRKIVLLADSQLLKKSELLVGLEQALQRSDCIVKKAGILGEPSPSLIDQLVQEFRPWQPDLVIAVGGGSVLDSGKAVAAMVPSGEPVIQYLEGVGTKTHDGRKIPMIAVPTTAGTGSEATKNAVLSQVGEKGFKKSLRHDAFVPEIALLDPELTFSCPPETTAASGMDCLTQLIESYLSTAANPFTDALALPAIADVLKYLPIVFSNPTDDEGRGVMQYAAYVSGITLAGAGLGTIHGIASALGGIVDVPHGVICGTMMSRINDITVQKLLASEPSGTAMKKYIIIAELISGREEMTPDDCVHLVPEYLSELTEKLRIPKLSRFGVRREHILAAVPLTENKKNPVSLTPGELKEALLDRL